MQNKYFLIGYPGSGKTTFGKKIARKCNLSFIDTDELIEQKYQTSIYKLLTEKAEPEFRRIEHEIFKIALQESNFIMATGGGLPCYYNNMGTILYSGISFYLKAKPEILYNRLKHSNNIRPLLYNIKDLMRHIECELKSREQFYNKANYIVESTRGCENKISNIIANITNL